MSGELKINEKVLGKLSEIELSGEVDIYTSQSLKDKLYSIIDNYQGDMRIDCKGLIYIDSTGLGILVGALKKVRSADGKFYISNLKDSIRKLFAITGLDKVFIIEE